LLSLGYQAPSPCAESFPCGRSSVIMGRSERQKGKHGSSSYGVNSERRPESTTRVLASRLSYPFLSRSLSLGISERICPAGTVFPERDGSLGEAAGSRLHKGRNPCLCRAWQGEVPPGWVFKAKEGLD
jgi:hypothetical protein